MGGGSGFDKSHERHRSSLEAASLPPADPAKDWGESRIYVQSTEGASATGGDEELVECRLLSKAELRRQLMAGIAAVLKANATYLEQVAERDSAVARWKDGYTSLFERYGFRDGYYPYLEKDALPQSSDVVTLRAALERFQNQVRELLDANTAALQSSEQLKSIATELARTKTDLAGCLQLCENGAELADAVAAARHLLARVSACGSNWAADNLHPYDNDTLQLPDNLPVLIEEGISVAAEAFRLNEEQIVQAPAFVAEPSVKEPARPSEEEVQRYLRQLEDAMHKRLRAQLWNGRTAQACRSLIEKIDGVRVALKECGETLPATYQRRLARAGARAVITNLDSARANLSQFLSDTDEPERRGYIDVTEATAEDAEHISALNALLTELALAMGRCNEALSIHNRAVNQPEQTVSYASIADNKNWKECLCWWQRKAAEAKAVAAQNLRTNTHIELSTEAAELCEKHEAAARLKIRRFLLSVPRHRLELDHVTTEPRLWRNKVKRSTRSVPWCNQVRVLMNAAAWALNGAIAAEEPRKPYQYPIF